MTYKIIEKFTLNEQFSFSSLQTKEYILANMLMTSTDSLEDYELINTYSLRANQLFIREEPRPDKEFRRHFYIGDDTRPVAYLIAFFQEKFNWDNMFNSQEMKDFIPAKQSLFSRIGWQFHGYRVIPDEVVLSYTHVSATGYDSNLFVSFGSTGVPITPSQADNIWDLSSEY